MKRITMFLILAFVVSGFLLAEGRPQAAESKVVVYAALDQKTANEWAAAFTKATGIPAEIALQIEQAGTVSARVKTEAANPRADVMIGGNSNVYEDLAASGLLQKYRSPVVGTAGIDAKLMDPNENWTGLWLGVVCLLYNNQRFQSEIASKGIAAPATWDDLLNPAYKGNLVAPSPVTSGDGFLILAAQVFRLGNEQAGFDYVTKLNSNVSQWTKGANGAIPLVSQGEDIIGIAWGHDTIRQKVAGNLPITVVFPKDAAFELGAGGILKGAPHPAAAKKFIDFLLSQEAEQINANNGYRYPLRNDVQMPPAMPPMSQVQIAPWNFAQAAANLTAWQKRWSQITGQ